jgi:serine/threonine-protein kinase
VAKFLSAETTNTQYGRFELIAELASGGMATVFLARLVGTAGFQRFVAIKRLHPHLAREPEFVEMFLDEARLAARIHHPHVVPIQEVGEADGAHYLVMDYIEGDTFARLLSRGTAAGKRVPPGVTARIMVEALRGLHAAHELVDDQGNFLGLVHRDVSPQNIMVAVDGLAKITDFGVARANARLTTTRTGQLKGKLAYMAPEQARGQVVDRRADIFAAGIVLWEALAMKRLFRGDGDAEVLQKILSQPIPLPTVFQPDVPDALVAVTMKALEREPEARFADASLFADALEDAARTEGIYASQRDVATVLTEVLGTELSAQRTSVRGWLAGPGSAPRERVVDATAIVTRVERPSSADGSSKRFIAVTPSVHGVPGAAILAPEGTPSGAAVGAATVSVATAPPPEKRRRGFVVPLLLATVVLLAVGLGISMGRRSDRASGGATSAVANGSPATTAAAVAASGSLPIPSVISRASAPVPAASASASAAPSASAKARVLGPLPKHKPHDDMAENPYR